MANAASGEGGEIWSIALRQRHDLVREGLRIKQILEAAQQRSRCGYYWYGLASLNYIVRDEW